MCSGLFHTWFPLPHMCTVPRYGGRFVPKTLRCHNSAGVWFHSTFLKSRHKTKRQSVETWEDIERVKQGLMAELCRMRSKLIHFCVCVSLCVCCFVYVWLFLESCKVKLKFANDSWQMFFIFFLYLDVSETKGETSLKEGGSRAGNFILCLGNGSFTKQLFKRKEDRI